MRSIAKLLLLTVAALWLCSPVVAQQKKDEKKDEGPMVSATFSGLEWRGIGPALMSGRISDIVVHPSDQSTWYVAVGSGGVWKTTNSGTTWTPIFDGQVSYSIGCITLDPNDADIVWVGTGENVGGRHVAYGDGVYRSLDGGQTWEHKGLKNSEHIGNIIVHPEDSNTVYVAAQGPLWSAGGDRGLFKTTDGGENWEKLLGDDQYTGVNEVRMDPRDPDILYAATHQKLRTVAALINGGPGSGIHKSMDGGKTWRELKTGLPSEDMGKIGLAISPQNPDVVYATIELDWREGGFWRSINAGASWEKRSDYVSGGTGPHYYQEIFASPHKFDRIYQMDPTMHVSEDGGKTFVPVGEKWKHGDNHALAFSPHDPDYLLVGTDGGVYESWDLGKNYKFVSNLPITQFYKVAVDYDVPFYNVYGGTQDNNTQGGPSRTANVHGIRNSDWFVTLFGDGHQPAVDYSNPDIVYSEWQEGNLVRYDRNTGEIVYIKPQPGKDEPAERFNWDAPILISPHDPATIFYASQRVWRSDDRGDSWTAISGDLTRDMQRLEMPMMDDRSWSVDSLWDLWAMSNFSTITSLSQSPTDANIIYAGTDDGLVQVTEDGGQTWRKIPVGEMPGVPDMAFVNDIKADLHDANTVYVCLDNHKEGDFRPFVMKSTDRGKSWTAITGDLPERHLVWRLVQDHEDPKLLFVGTEFGVFFTRNDGQNWIELSGGLPTISFRDLAIQTRENDLVGATFGRGFYILDDYTPLRNIDVATLEKEATLFPVKDAYWYIPKRTLGSDEKASQGSDFFTAPNPDFGAIFTYYLKDSYETQQKVRQKEEKKLAEAGEDVPFPGWDALRDESLEDKPAVVFTIKDDAGQVVRRVTGPAAKGFHRVAWDLRYPTGMAWSPNAGGGFFGMRGWLAAPGTYTVDMALHHRGEIKSLGEPQSFVVKPLPGNENTLPGMAPAEMTAFLQKVDDLQGAVSAANNVVNRLETRVKAIGEVYQRSTMADTDILANLEEMERTLYQLGEALGGHKLKGRMGEPAPHSIGDRMSVILIGNLFSTYGPTPTHVQQFELAKEEFAAVRSQLDRLRNEDLPALEAKLDAAGVPWTPGREIPQPQ